MENDVIQVLIGLLEAGWNEGIVPKPEFLKQWDTKYVDENDSDKVIIYYTGERVKTPSDILYNTEDHTVLISLDVRTLESEERYILLFEEIERIRAVNRRDPGSDWHRWDFIRESVFHRPQRFRGVFDYSIKAFSVTI